MRKFNLFTLGLTVIVATIFVSQASVSAHVNYRSLSKEHLNYRGLSKDHLNYRGLSKDNLKRISLQKSLFNHYYKMKQWVKMTFVQQGSDVIRNSGSSVNRTPIGVLVERHRTPIAIPMQ